MSETSSNAPENQDDNSLGNVPATSVSSLQQMIASSLGLAAQNAVFAQQQANIMHQAVTILGIQQLYSVGSSPSKVSDSLQETIQKLQEIIALAQDSSEPEETKKAQAGM
ncbi:MAG: RebB family R body protein [Crocosphaera sp.]